MLEFREKTFASAVLLNVMASLAVAPLTVISTSL